MTDLVVVPDDALHRVPFEALRMQDGRMVVERFAVSYAPSASVLARLRARARPSGSAVLALADPSFESDGPSEGSEVGAGPQVGAGPLVGSGAGMGVDAELYRAAFAAAGGLPRLPASAREGRSVVRHSDEGELLLRERASEAFLKTTPLTRYRVLHFASHAVVDERTVTRTALALAPGGGEDGFLSPAELASLQLDADLVVLSACRTAGGVVVRGEGTLGLTAPLLEAGARAVLATAWQVEDKASAAFVEDFYRELAAGLPAGRALREAKLAALARGAPAREWSAFTLVGDPFVTVPLRAAPSLWIRGALAALALAVVLGVALGIRRLGLSARV